MKYVVKDLINFSAKEFKEKVKNCKDLTLEVRNFGELMMVTEHIPSSVTSLTIHSSDGFLPLGGKANLNKFFSALPETVTSLNFSRSAIDHYSYSPESQLILLNALPKHVTQFALSGEVFFDSLENKKFKIYKLKNPANEDRLTWIKIKTRYLDQLSTSEKQVKNKGLETVFDNMLILKQKINDHNFNGLVESKEYYQAESAAKNVFDSITDIIKLYLNGSINEVQFKIRTTYILDNESNPEDLYNSFLKHQYFIDHNKSELRQEIELLKNKNKQYQALRKDIDLLKTHRGYKELIVNFLAACLSLFIPYLITAAIKRNLTVFKLPTDSAAKVHNLCNEINRVQCTIQI